MKIAYLGTTSIKRMWKNKFVAFVQIVCVALGMLVPFFFIGQYYAAHINAENNVSLINTTGMIQLEPDMEKDITDVMPISEISEFLKMFPQEEIHFVNAYSTNDVWINSEVSPGSSIYIVDASVNKMWRGEWLKEGTGLKKGKRDCMVGNLFAKKKQISVGDTIEVDQKKFLVSGICNVPAYKNSILLNGDGCSDIQLWDVKYYVRMQKIEEKKVNKIENYIFGKSGICKISREEEITQKYYEKLQKGWSVSVIISIISMLYGMVNLYNILYFFFMKTRKNLFICMTQGSSRLDIFIQKYLEIGINTFFSSILCYLFLRVIQASKIQYMFEIKIDSVIFLLMLLVGQFLACIYACFLIKKTNKMSIAQQLRL